MLKDLTRSHGTTGVPNCPSVVSRKTIKDFKFSREFMDRFMEVWSRAWAVFMTDPVPLGMALVTFVGVTWAGAWFHRGRIAKGRIAALKERLQLAKEEQQLITKQVERLTAQISEQGRTIDELKNVADARSEFDKLSSANAAVSSSLSDLHQATTGLGMTLTISGTGLSSVLKSTPNQDHNPPALRLHGS